jgi:hypothetical protein
MDDSRVFSLGCQETKAKTKTLITKMTSLLLLVANCFWFISARSALSSYSKGGAFDILFSTGNAFLKIK